MIQSAQTFQSAVADFIDPEWSARPDLTGNRVHPAGLLVPQNRSDIIRIVQLARSHRARLHVVSCGHNWGFGSSLPRKAGTWIVNLANLRRISSYDPETGSVRIEPGVTQIALYRQLKSWGGDWLFNVTGAGHETSVLGNALERGIGYHGQRHLDLIEVEVLIGSGEVICSRIHSDSPASLGLDLTQLFTHSALGIVLSARLRLMKRSTGGGAVIARLVNEARTPEFFAAVLQLKADGVVAGVPHVANRARILTTMAPWLPATDRPVFAKRIALWTAAFPLRGCREMTETSVKMIEKQLGRFCELQPVFATNEAVDEENVSSPMQQLEQLASGYPSNLAIPGVEWTALDRSNTAHMDPESTGAGLIHVTPAVDSSLGEIQRCLSIVERSADSIGLGELPITVNIVDQILTVLVVSVGFPANSALSFRRKARALEQNLLEAGIHPYRIGVGQEQWLPNSSTEREVVCRKIQRVLDPGGIFETSKYAGTPKKRHAVPNITAASRVQMEAA